MMKRAHAIQQLRMCQAFSAAGEEVRFVSPKDGNGDPSWDVVSDFYGLEEEFDLKAIRAPLQNMSFPNYPIPDTDTQAITYWLLYMYLSRNFDEGDVIYSRNLHPTRYFLSFLDLVGGGDEVSVWFEAHQVDRGIDDTRLSSTEEFYRQLDGVVCISQMLKRRIIERHFVDPEKLVVAHDGVDVRSYEGLSMGESRERLGFDPDERIVMYTGHLYPAKGVETLVEAAADLDAHCYVVGGYPEDVSRIRDETTVPENVTFTGFVPPSEIPLYQTAADVLVATVAEESEMDFFSPLKLFEYMAAGKPIVMSRRPEYEEVLTHGETALFVEPGSVSELAEAIGRILSDPQSGAELGRQARREVEKYDWNVRARNILEEIGVRSTVGDGGSGSIRGAAQRLTEQF